MQAAQQDLAGSGRTAILFAVDGQVAGIIGLADAPRDTSIDAVSSLQRMGVTVVMLGVAMPLCAILLFGRKVR